MGEQAAYQTKKRREEHQRQFVLQRRRKMQQGRGGKGRVAAMAQVVEAAMAYDSVKEPDHPNASLFTKSPEGGTRSSGSDQGTPGTPLKATLRQGVAEPSPTTAGADGGGGGRGWALARSVSVTKLKRLLETTAASDAEDGTASSTTRLPARSLRRVSSRRNVQVSIHAQRWSNRSWPVTAHVVHRSKVKQEAGCHVPTRYVWHLHYRTAHRLGHCAARRRRRRFPTVPQPHPPSRLPFERCPLSCRLAVKLDAMR